MGHDGNKKGAPITAAPISECPTLKIQTQDRTSNQSHMNSG